MAMDSRSSGKCLILTLIASSALSASCQDAWVNAWEKVGAAAGCKDKNEGDMCEYSPQAIEDNYMFSYTHDQQLQKSIVEILEWNGIAKEDFHHLLVVKSRTGKAMDLNFLNLPDIFDGGVTPNDFPVKVFLKETWSGKCNSKGMCMGVRSILTRSCETADLSESCSYGSLDLEKKRLKEAMPKTPFSFEGTCEGKDDWKWCMMSTSRERQIEACLGKMPGKSCQYTGSAKAGYDNTYKGLCMGANAGNVLYCKGVKAGVIEACEGKPRGSECSVLKHANGDPSDPAWKGKCNYGDATLQCMNGKEPSNPVVPSPSAPGSPPGGGSSCSSLEKKVGWMSGVLKKVATKMGVDTSMPAPAPAPAPREGKGKGGRRRKAEGRRL